MSKGLTTDQINSISGSQVKTRILLTITFNNVRDNIELEDGSGDLVQENSSRIYLEPDVIYLLENDTLTTLDINGRTYLAGAVKRGNIESRIEGGKQSVSITLSNIDRTYSGLVANNGDILTNATCKIEEVIYTPPGNNQILLETVDEVLLETGDSLLQENDSPFLDTINIFEGFINRVTLTPTDFKFNVERILGGYSTQSPNTTYDVNCQWRFKDIRCRYSGTLYSTCDKTFTQCQERGNESRFGGYPSIPAELVIRG